MRSTESLSLCVSDIGIPYMLSQFLLPDLVAKRINLPVRFEQEIKSLPCKFLHEMCVGECAKVEIKA